jgi:hypothetical protein
MFSRFRSYYIIQIICGLFVLSLCATPLASDSKKQQPSTQPAAQKLQPVSAKLTTLYNKSISLFSYLNFTNDPAYKYLIPVNLNSLLEDTLVEQIQGWNQATSLKNTLTIGLSFEKSTEKDSRCRDIGTEMQWLYTYYLYPLNCNRFETNCAASTFFDSDPPECIAKAKQALDQNTKFISYLNALKTASVDAIRIKTCPFQYWEEADETGSPTKCKAANAWFTAAQVKKDMDIIYPALQTAQTDSIVCTENCQLNPLRNNIVSMVTQSIKTIAIMNQGVYWSGDNSGAACYTKKSNGQKCATWLKTKWVDMTGIVDNQQEILEKLVKGYIVHFTLLGEQASTVETAPSQYSIINLLRPYGYDKEEQISAATKYISILGNASQLPDIIVPSADPLESSVYYHLGHQYGGDYSVHYAAPGDLGLHDFGSTNIASAPTGSEYSMAKSRLAASARLRTGILAFNQNMRSLATGQTIMLASFYNTIMRRSLNPATIKKNNTLTFGGEGHYIRPDWRTTSKEPATLRESKEINPEQTALRFNNTKIFSSKSYTDFANNMADGPAWREAINKATPSVVEKETLYALTDLLGIAYQSQLLEERLLIILSMKGLQSMSGSGLLSETNFFKDAVINDVYTFATGSTEANPVPVQAAQPGKAQDTAKTSISKPSTAGPYSKSKVALIKDTTS